MDRQPKPLKQKKITLHTIFEMGKIKGIKKLRLLKENKQNQVD
jgi:hypothetical protein